jgi:hypothetical protein
MEIVRRGRRGEAIASAGAADVPVTMVTMEQATAFCSWKGGSLPTIEVWESAIRAHDARLYPWGHDVPTCERANLRGCEEGPAPAGRTDGRAMALVADGRPVEAARLGEPAARGLARWSQLVSLETGIVDGRTLMAAGATGQETVVAMLLGRPNPGTGQFGRIAPEHIIPWLELLAAHGSTPGAREIARQWSKAMAKEVAEAARAADAAIGARLDEGQKK